MGRCGVFIWQILNVDLSHVEGKVNEMLKHDSSLTLLQGELISRFVVSIYMVLLYILASICGKSTQSTAHPGARIGLAPIPT